MPDGLLEIFGLLSSPFRAILRRFTNCKKVPPGIYLVTDGQDPIRSKIFGLVYLDLRWLVAGDYNTRFRPLKPVDEAGAAWIGQFKIKDNQIAEGTYRYLDSPTTGPHTISLIERGLLRVLISSHEHPDRKTVVFWIMI